MPKWDKKDKLLFDQVRDELRREHWADTTMNTLKAKIENLGYFREKYRPGVKNLKWYALADQFIRDHRFTLIIIPPGWGKTFGYTENYPLMRICQNRKTRGLIISKSAEKAMDFMHPIKHQLEHNGQMINDFGGPFFDADSGQKWTEKKLTVLGASPNEQTPTISNIGTGGQIESNRVDWIILDDPFDFETARSKTAAEKFISQFHTTIFTRLQQGGKIIFITHRFGKNDVVERLLKEVNIFSGDVGGILTIPAIQGEGPPGAAWVPGVDIGHSTCPELFPDNELQIKKMGTPLYIWKANYLQAPIFMDKTLFDTDWISSIIPANAVKWVDFDPRLAVKDISVDPAYTDLSHKGDYTGVTVLGPHPMDKQGIIIWAMYRLDISMDFVKEYRNLWDMHMPRNFYVEANNAKTLPDSLRAGGIPNVIPLSATKDKHTRINALSPLFQFRPGDALAENQHRFYFHKDLLGRYESAWKTFMDEYGIWTGDLSNKNNDHILDALAQYYLECYTKQYNYTDFTYHHSKW